MQHDILEKLSQIESVSSASFTTTVPMDGNNSNDPIPHAMPNIVRNERSL